MGTFIFRLCIDNTLCLVTAFDKIEAEHMLEKNKGIISKAEYYFVGVTSGDRKSTRLNSSHSRKSRMPSSA